MGVRHGGDGLVDVIEDDHAIVEGEAEIGQAPVVRRRLGKALDIAYGVIAGVTHCAAAEPGNTAGTKGSAAAAINNSRRFIGSLSLWRFPLLGSLT